MKPYRNFSGTLGLIIVCIFVFIMYFGKKKLQMKIKKYTKTIMQKWRKISIIASIQYFSS